MRQMRSVIFSAPLIATLFTFSIAAQDTRYVPGGQSQQISSPDCFIQKGA